LLSLRAKRSKLVVKNIKHFEIAASQKSLLAMTIQDFFSKLLKGGLSMSLVLPRKNVLIMLYIIKAGIFRKMPALLDETDGRRRELNSLSNRTIYRLFFYEVLRNTPKRYPENTGCY